MLGVAPISYGIYSLTSNFESKIIRETSSLIFNLGDMDIIHKTFSKWYIVPALCVILGVKNVINEIFEEDLHRKPKPQAPPHLNPFMSEDVMTIDAHKNFKSTAAPSKSPQGIQKKSIS